MKDWLVLILVGEVLVCYQLAVTADIRGQRPLQMSGLEEKLIDMEM